MVNFTTPNLPGASDIYNKIAVLGQGKTIEVCDKDLDKFAELIGQKINLL